MHHLRSGKPKKDNFSTETKHKKCALKSYRILSRKLGMVVHTVIPATQEVEIDHIFGGLRFQTNRTQKVH
jgi:hypothetical protein